MIDNIHDNGGILQSLSAHWSAVGAELSIQQDFGFGSDEEVLLMVSVADFPIVRLRIHEHLD